MGDGIWYGIYHIWEVAKEPTLSEVLVQLAERKRIRFMGQKGKHTHKLIIDPTE